MLHQYLSNIATATTILTSLLLVTTTTAKATKETTTSSSSPLFLLASTKSSTSLSFPLLLDHQSSSNNAVPTSNDVSKLLWRYLSDCPTKRYVVVVEPQTLAFVDHPSASASGSPPKSEKEKKKEKKKGKKNRFIPRAPNAQSIFSATDIQGGNVNIVHVLNTILMDCLHHDVLHVHEVNTTTFNTISSPFDSTENLDVAKLEKSIVYARMPPVNSRVIVTETQLNKEMRRRREFVEDVVIGKYLSLGHVSDVDETEIENGDVEDYTFIYIREREEKKEVERKKSLKMGMESGVVGGSGGNGNGNTAVGNAGDEQEVPLVNGE